jgi:hypothetical protein
MRNKILLTLCVLSSIYSTAQEKPNTAFAIVSNGNGRMNWMNIQEIDLNTGEVVRKIFDREKTSFALVDAVSKKKLIQDEKKMVVIGSPMPEKSRMVKAGISVKLVNPAMNPSDPTPFLAYEHPTATMVAAAAYDKRHNKLFFTPMYFSELRWIDLYDKSNTVQVFCFTGNMMTTGESSSDANQFTRMVIGADGHGYVLSNDSRNLIRFTTGKKPQITKLGELKDDAENVKSKVSIHNRNMFGGDMIADAFGNLFLITSSSAVFKIDLQLLQASYMGNIKGLPKHFTTNGAAVSLNGDIIVSSANAIDGYYKLSLSDLSSEKLPLKSQPSTSDLASGNLAFEKEVDNLTGGSIVQRNALLNRAVSVFPNPVTTGAFKVTFSNTDPGQYNLQLVDLSGKIVHQQRINVALRNQLETIPVHEGLAKGMYQLKISDRKNKVVSAGNIFVQ